MDEEGDDIPSYTINLSAPPEHRYDHLIPEFKEKVESADIEGVFNTVVYSLGGHWIAKILTYASRVALRRLCSDEETAELRGFSRAFGVPMYLLVAFNVLLDLLLGCTSGGALAVDPRVPPAQRAPMMLHFRTLDWGMDELRRLTVQLNFVREKDGPVIATSVTYLGYIGVLTGVRKGLSLSLNFRPHHSRETLRQRAAFRTHQAMVVLGLRRSISSTLRQYLLDGQEVDMAHILDDVSKSPSTAAYLTFCTPRRVFIVEKDHRHAAIRESDTFLDVCNHDATDEDDPSLLQRRAQEAEETDGVIGVADLLNFSIDRAKILDEAWKKRVRRSNRYHGKHGEVVTKKDIIQLVRTEEVFNEQTHYAVVMNPTTGVVEWAKVYPYWDSDDSEDDSGESEEDETEVDSGAG